MMPPGRAVLLVAVIAAGLRAGEPDDLAPYAARAGLHSTIRIWGSEPMASLVARWEAGFRRDQPDVRFENRLLGTGTAMAGLYAGGADLALMGRDATPKELQAFEWVFRHPPQRIDVVTGSRDQGGRSPALVVYVPRDNPLAGLTLAQLAAMVGCEPPDGAAPAQVWGRIGLSGRWANRPIHVYTYDTETGTGTFLQHRLLGDSRKWAWDRVTEFRDRTTPGGGQAVSAGRQIVAALAADPDGLGFATLADAAPSVRAVPLTPGPGSRFVAATTGTLIDQTYPLARILPAYFNRVPGRPLDPAVAAFLDYLVSRQGQRDVVQDGGYLPLSTAAAARARRQLE